MKKSLPPSSPSSTTPVGVRLSSADKDFLKTTWPNLTSSKALRLMLDEARQQRALPTTHEEAVARIVSAVGGLPTIRPDGLRRSAVVEDLIRDASLLLAEVSLITAQTQEDSAQCMAFEDRVVGAGMEIVEALMRHALPQVAGAWNPSVVRDHIQKIRPLLIEVLAALAPSCLPRSSSAAPERSSHDRV